MQKMIEDVDQEDDGVLMHIVSVYYRVRSERETKFEF